MDARDAEILLGEPITFPQNDPIEVKRRVLFYSGEFDDGSVRDAKLKILAMLDREVDPIWLHIDSDGGEVLPGLSFFDFLMWCQSEGAVINTVVTGRAYSMAFYILQAGQYRIATTNASLMLHEPKAGAYGETARQRMQVDHYAKIESRMYNLVSIRTGQPLTTILDWARGETWWTAEEALEDGVVDEVR